MKFPYRSSDAGAVKEDSIPPAERRVRLHARGVVFLLLAAAVGTAATIRSNNLLFLIFSVMVGIFLSSAVLTLLLPRRVEVLRLLPDSAYCGETLLLRLRIRNGNRFFPCIALRVEDRVAFEARGLAAAPSPSFLPLLRAGATEFSAISLPLPYRGWANFGPLRITSEFPPGFLTLHLRWDLKDSLLVYPRRARLLHPVVDPVSPRLPVWGDAAASVPRGREEFAGLREYRPGDNPRDIHWKASARAPNRWRLREFEDPFVRRAVVYLDTHVPTPGDARLRRRLERAISFAGALAERLLDDRYEIEFRAFGPHRIARTFGPGPGILQDFLGLLAELKASRFRRVEELLRPDDTGLRILLRLGEEEAARDGSVREIDAPTMRAWMEDEE